MSSPEPQSSIIAWIGNSASAGVALGALLGWLPPIAAVITMIWCAIQIYESDTVTRWRQRRLRNRLVRLHAQASELELHLSQSDDEEAIKRLKEMMALRTTTDFDIKKIVEEKTEKKP